MSAIDPLLDVVDELPRIIARARLLEVALVHAPEQMQGESYADAARQQIVDLVKHLVKLSESLEMVKAS